MEHTVTFVLDDDCRECGVPWLRLSIAFSPALVRSVYRDWMVGIVADKIVAAMEKFLDEEENDGEEIKKGGGG